MLTGAGRGHGQALLGAAAAFGACVERRDRIASARFCAETQTALNPTPRPVITPATQEPDLSLAHANERRSDATGLGDAIWPGESDFQSVVLKFLL